VPNVFLLRIVERLFTSVLDNLECVFSGSRHTVSWNRVRLGAQNIKKTECLSNWNKNNLIRHVYEVVKDEIIDLSSSKANYI
jgi:hypothetical protein